MKRKLLILIPLIIFQTLWLALYVNGVFAIEIFLYDRLPRIVNALLVFWGLPMLMAGIFSYISQQLFRQLANYQVIQISMLPIYFSTILWLPILVFQYFGGKDYFDLIQKQAIHRTTIEGTTNLNFKKVGFIRLTAIQPKREGRSYYSYTSSVKNGGSYTKVRHYYCVVPVLSNFNLNNRSTSFWVSANDTDKMPGHIADTIQHTITGLVVHDPYAIRYYKKAAKKAQNGYQLAKEQAPVFIQPTADYDTVLQYRKQRALWILAVVNGLFVGIPLIWMIRMSRNRLAVGN